MFFMAIAGFEQVLHCLLTYTLFRSQSTRWLCFPTLKYLQVALNCHWPS